MSHNYAATYDAGFVKGSTADNMLISYILLLHGYINTCIQTFLPDDEENKNIYANCTSQYIWKAYVKYTPFFRGLFDGCTANLINCNETSGLSQDYIDSTYSYGSQAAIMDFTSLLQKQTAFKLWNIPFTHVGHNNPNLIMLLDEVFTPVPQPVVQPPLPPTPPPNA